MTHPYRRHPTLRPGDIAVALQLAITPGAQYEFVAQFVRVSVSESHNAVKRLELAHLADARRRIVFGQRLLDFLHHGVPYAFPPILGPHAVGVPVTHPRLPARQPLPGTDSIVWPWGGGRAAGVALMPLYRSAPRVNLCNRRLHELLVIVDLMRLGHDAVRDPTLDLLLGHGLKRATWS